MKHAVRWFSNVVAAVAASVVANARELVFAFGMGLVAYGLSRLSIAAACIVPGAILVWLAIPQTARRSK